MLLTVPRILAILYLHCVINIILAHYGQSVTEISFVAHATTFNTIPHELFIIYDIKFCYCTFTSPLHRISSDVFPCACLEFMCCKKNYDQYFLFFLFLEKLLFHIFVKECITDTEKCNISGGILLTELCKNQLLWRSTKNQRY